MSFSIDEWRETLSDCNACMAALCSVCGHPPCPVCVDDCDHTDCITWTKTSGKKTHVCEFVRCAEHAALAPPTVAEAKT